MRRDKVHRQTVLLAVGKEVLNPSRTPLETQGICSIGFGFLPNFIRHVKVARSGTADAQLRIHRFQRRGGDLIKFEILSLRACEKALVEIRLVPDFKVPASHLVSSIALNAVHGKTMHQFCPFAVVRRRTSIASPPESNAALASCYIRRKETQFHKWPRPVFQHSVEKVVDVLEVV